VWLIPRRIWTCGFVVKEAQRTPVHRFVLAHVQGFASSAGGDPQWNAVGSGRVVLRRLA
jgi:hypothetical protein